MRDIRDIRGSITQDSNPEGINQYSGAADRAHEATKIANKASRHADSRKSGLADEKAAIKAHLEAAKAHQAAAKAAGKSKVERVYLKGVPHAEKAKEHIKQAQRHGGRYIFRKARGDAAHR